MSVSEVTEMWSRQRSSVASRDGKTFTVRYSSAYQVVHSADATEDEILYADGVPQLRDGYQGNQYIPCTKVGDTQPVGPIMTIVPVEWEGEVSRNNGSPLDQRAAWSLENVVSLEETDVDGYGYPLTNSIGEPVKGLVREVWDWKLTLSQNFLAFNSYALEQYSHAVNSDNFGPPGNIWPPGTARLQGGLKISPTDDEALGYFKVGATILFRSPINTTPSRSWWWRYRNEGNYERVGTNVTFGASPTGNTAAGYAITNGSGVVTAIAVTNPGSGYTAAPTVTITSSTGGSGASATAVLDGERVASVTIGAGGTSYKSKIKRAVDDNKEPFSKPVLLAADGTRLDDSDSAVFLERPRYPYALPFSLLGFIF